MCVSVNYFRHVVHHLQSLSPVQPQLAPMDLLSLRNLESKAVRGRRSTSKCHHHVSGQRYLLITIFILQLPKILTVLLWFRLLDIVTSCLTVLPAIRGLLVSGPLAHPWSTFFPSIVLEYQGWASLTKPVISRGDTFVLRPSDIRKVHT